MKKLITFVVVNVLLFVPSLSFSMSPIEVKFITKSVSIISPDYETTKYSDIEKIPDILYSSNIIANGMAILSYYKLEIILKNAQGIMVSKNPVTDEVILLKSENSRAGNIDLKFDEQTSAKLTPDAKIALRYKKNQVILKVLSGVLLVESKGKNYELGQDEVYVIK